ncbi:MAG: hypothetical protein JXA67_05605 [Micromonosporaceae bacterium]|nr:hypothetical protein [Micromonosporaceae bacterium]
MAGPQRIEWRRRWPRRALGNLQWYGVVACSLVACTWLLFGGESTQLETGGDNLLAQVPPAVTVLAAVGAVVMAIPVVARPAIAADHDVLLVRTGFGRTLSLPWACVDEVAVVAVGHSRYLLLRCTRSSGVSGDEPGWLEQVPLRGLTKHDPSRDWGKYDLAVPMQDFVGAISAQVAALAAFAPDTVTFVN